MIFYEKVSDLLDKFLIPIYKDIKNGDIKKVKDNLDMLLETKMLPKHISPYNLSYLISYNKVSHYYDNKVPEDCSDLMEMLEWTGLEPEEITHTIQYIYNQGWFFRENLKCLKNINKVIKKISNELINN